MAYVLRGNQVGDHSMADLLGTIPVLPAGWTDVSDIRGLGRRCVREQWRQLKDIVIPLMLAIIDLQGCNGVGISLPHF